MAQDSVLQNLISNVNNKKGTYPAARLVQEDPIRAANISKMIRDNDGGSFDIKRKNAEMGLNAAQMQAISESIMGRSKDNESVVKLFPDLELAIQILVSSIISPKDMVACKLIYKAAEPIFPSELTSQLNDVASQEMEGHYRFKDEMPGIIRDALFESGSHVKVVFPESIVDALINETSSFSNEAFVELFDDKKSIRHLGLLGNSNIDNENNSRMSSLESFFSDKPSTTYRPEVRIKHNQQIVALEYLEVTDNFHFLKFPKVIEVGNKNRLKEMSRRQRNRRHRYLEISQENFNQNGKKLTTGELHSVLYKDQSRDYEHMSVVTSSRNQKRKSIGRPLVMKMPSESVIPVYVPGQPEKHIGYFMMVDVDGNPVSRSSLRQNADGLQGLLSNQNNNQSMNSLLIDKAKKNLVTGSNVPQLDNIVSVYASIVENDLLERLNNGLAGSNVEIMKDQELYRIMLARSLKGKLTRLVYVPAEYVSYFAFKYHENGVGKTYLDDVKDLMSIRAILLFSKVMAQVKSSINVTKVKMRFDEDDIDPLGSMEQAQHEVAKMRQMYFPLGINAPVDLFDWVTRAGLEWSFDEHPGLPNTSFEFSTDNLKHEIPDSSLDEDLRKQTYMSFGISPETIDNGFNQEFATTAINNNILFSKRVSQHQDIASAQATAHAGRIIRHDETIREKMFKIFKDNRGLLEKMLDDEEKALLAENETIFYEEMIEKYIDNLRIEFPRPDVTTIDTQTEAFKKFEEAVEGTMDYVLSDKVVSEEFIGVIGGKMEAFREMYKAYRMRQWMADNNYLPEMSDIINTDEENKPLINIMEIMKNHVESLTRSFVGYIQATAPVKTALDNDLNNLGQEEGMSGTTDTGTDEGGGEAGGDGFGTDFGLGGDGTGEGDGSGETGEEGNDNP